MLDAVRERAVGAAYAAGWRAVRVAPEPISARAFRTAADVAVARHGGSVAQLRRNLHRVLGSQASPAQLDAVVADAMRSYARYWLETFRLQNMDRASVVADVQRNTIGAEHIEDGLRAGNGVILALPHSGNWDASGVWLVARHGPFTTVAERLRPASLFDRFVAYRESLGMEVLALTGGPRPAATVLADRLRTNRVVCLLADRDLSGTGIDVDFFGARARMPGGPALLAAQTGAALLPVHAYFTDTGWGHTIGAPLPVVGERLRERVRGTTQLLADGFATAITTRPQDWHMLAPLWLEDLPAGRVAPVTATV